MGRARLSVIIPAHNESALIGRLLLSLLADTGFDELEIVVIANGCTDDTAAVARAVSDRITVIELDTASKIAALNAGDAATDTFPRAYVDADVTVTTDTLLALADVLADDVVPLAAAPRFVVDTALVDGAARRYYAVWQLSPYRSDSPIGAGIYALSRAGRARFGAFPDLIADDQFVHELFAPDERIVLADREFSVEGSRTVPDLLGRLTRATVGNEQLRAFGPAGPGASDSGAGPLIRRVARTPSVWFAFPTYARIYLAARREARRRLAEGGPLLWTRDDSTRG